LPPDKQPDLQAGLHVYLFGQIDQPAHGRNFILKPLFTGMGVRLNTVIVGNNMLPFM
jgi:hypothetical protein